MSRSYWEDILLLKTEMSDGGIFRSSWSIGMLAFIWFYFSILYVFFEIRDRWKQFSLDDKNDLEYESYSIKPGQVKRCYTVRLRSDMLSSSYRDPSASICIKFFFLKERIGQLMIPITSYRKHGNIYTDLRGVQYHVILLHWYTTSNLSNVDEIRIAHSGQPESPEIYFRDLDVREPELKIRIHSAIYRKVEPFPFVPGAGISLTPIQLNSQDSDNFRSPFEKVTQSEIIIFMFVQSNITQTAMLWLPTLSPNTKVTALNAMVYGLIFYSITTFLVIMAAAYYQMIKIHLSPLRKTNLKKFRHTFFLAICSFSSILLLIASGLATRYPRFPIKFWLLFAIVGHIFQALVMFIVTYWYTKKFSLELKDEKNEQNICQALALKPLKPLTRCIQPELHQTSGSISQQSDPKSLSKDKPSDFTN
ncbi:uncharacterized protein LOC112539202 [Tetranychus urticae]|uniref:uncharacterized protein LOC112539202 n=1 Tax=Tetranychus urticae TaxID=32264 RepID=UPI000D6474CA|nr:uncharacterized protein LOC112539202 [Tetranychus urticae]XP_025017293.1 uncharacterized protein LOC112539202 [Tetranychus urticae]XP_025017294.1 uncharacterized protein LOC112539202 [Tetranychus urticae]XP_025017295.1 uncharacterized protein LOC112539202 [Tetranychus urticae]XP_025017296.1 uncharacterized protein LOC112539202 [Tetranychus urticae]